MSTEIAVQTEHRLVKAMADASAKIAASPEIVRALAVAEQLATGLVIASPEEAASVADAVATVIDAERRIAVARADAVKIPRAMIEAVDAALESAKDRLAAAKRVGNDARVAYQALMRRQAAEEEAARRRAAEEAAKRAQAEDADAPVAEVAPVVVPRTVAGGTGKQGTQVRITAAEIVTLEEVPREWMVLAPSVAAAVFSSAVLERKARKPEPGESVVYRGVRFEARETAVNRRN